VLSALLSIELERSRELAILRTLGFTPRELTTTLLAQNRPSAPPRIGRDSDRHGARGSARSRHQPPIVRLEHGLRLLTRCAGDGLLLAVGAALLAGVYPALRSARGGLAGALREE
jgi:putative ABC transport system permease protein